MSSLVVLADDLTMDAAAAAAQRMAWLGTSGSGKSYGCGRYVEQLHAANIPVLIVDTVGIWPALRLSADGKKAGLPFVIVGGEHSDVPIDLARGSELARFLISQNASAVIDVSDYDPQERAPFVADLCNALLMEMKVKAIRRPRVVVFDEAQDVAPQVPGKGEARMCKAVSGLIRKGRNHLCGTVLLSQRPADVSKSALNLAGNLFVGAMFAKHERQAVRDWAGAKARSAAVEEQLKDLPELQPGEFFFWSPQWLRVYQRIRVLPKWTFDGSSSTPIDASAELGKLAPVDVKALRALLTPAAAPVHPPTGSAVPAAVRAAARKGGGPASPAPDRGSELHIVEQLRVGLEQRVQELEKTLTLTRDALADELAASRRAAELYATVRRAVDAYVDSSPRIASAPLAMQVKGPGITQKGRTVADPEVERVAAQTSTNEYRSALLDTIATYGPLDRTRLSILSGKSKSSTTFASAIRSLVAGRFITDEAGMMAATAHGRRECPGTPLPTGRALYGHWKAKLTPYEAETFEAIAKVKAGLTRAELAERTGHSASSTTFAAAIRRLKAMGLAFEADGRRIALLEHVRTAMGLG